MITKITNGHIHICMIAYEQLRETDSALVRSQRVMRDMMGRARTNKLLMYTLIFILVAAILYLFYTQFIA